MTSIIANLALGADPASIATWFFSVIDAMTARIQTGYALNRNNTMEFLRRHAALNGAQVLPIPGSLDVARARSRLHVAGPVAFDGYIAGGADTDEAIRRMSDEMSSVAGEEVRDGDRQVNARSTGRGRGIVGWRRRLSGHACGFCAMLASRGAVYNSRESATIAKDGMPYHGNAKGGFCHCWAEPGYAGQLEPVDVQRLDRQWKHVTAGKSQNNAINAWRRHWEQRATPAARAREGILGARSGGGVATPGQAAQVRQLLADAKSAEQVSQTLAAELKRLTGRDIPVDLRGSVETAREHAEGVLQVMERFPQTVLDEIATERLTLFNAGYQGRRMIFDERYSSLDRRQRYLSELAEDKQRGWHPFDSPVGVASHEMGHALFVDTLPATTRRKVERVLERHGGPDAAARQISGYATQDLDELVAEAVGDVVMNAERASMVSRDVMAVLEADYKRIAGKAAKKATPAAPKMPAAIDRTLTPSDVLAAEERARVAALAAPPVKLRELPARSDAAKALKHYQLNGDDEANGLLRRGRVGRPANPKKTYKAPTEAEVRAAIEQIDATLARSELTEPIVLYRGMSRAPVAGPPGSTVGRKFSDKGFTSASASRREAAQFVAGEGMAESGVMLEIRVPAGSRAVGISDETFKGASPSVTSEQEILLDRGLTFRVVSDETLPDVYMWRGAVTVGQPYRHIVVEVVPAPAKATKAAATLRPAAPSPTILRREVTEAGITVPTGLRPPALQQLVADLRAGTSPAAARARAVESILDERRTVAEALQGASEQILNEASERALKAEARAIRNAVPAEALTSLRPLLDALDAGDLAAARAALPVVARGAKLKPIGEVGAVTKLPAPAKAAPTSPAQFEAQAKRATSGDGAVQAKVPTRSEDLAPEAAEALAGYQGPGFGPLNRYLRGNADPSYGLTAKEINQTIKPRVAAIDSAMAASPVVDDVVVWRGLGTGRGIFGGRLADDLTGFSWDEATYMSTSARESTALGFATKAKDSDGVLMRIVLPRDTGALSIAGNEAEILAQRGLRLRVVRDLGKVQRDGRSVRLLDVEVVPATPVKVAAPAPMSRVEWVGPERSQTVQVLRPGYETTFERSTTLLRPPAVMAATPEQVARSAPAKVAKKAAAKATPKASGVRWAPPDRKPIRTSTKHEFSAGPQGQVRAAITSDEMVEGKTLRDHAQILAALQPDDVAAYLDWHGFTKVELNQIRERQVRLISGDPTMSLPANLTPLPFTKAEIRELIIRDTPLAARSVTPGMKAAARAATKAAKASVNGAYDLRLARLRSAMGSPVTGSINVEQGVVGRVRGQVRGDTRVVLKENLGADAVRATDAEELAARVMDAVGVRAPAVLRLDETSMLQEFIDGVPASRELVGDVARRKALAESADGRLIGLADILTGNSDRKLGNLIVTRDGRLVAIDNGAAFVPDFELTFSSADEFSRPLLGESNDLLRADLAQIRARIEALRPEFERLGHLDWYRDVQRRLKWVEARAQAPAKAAVKKATPAKKAPAPKAPPAPAKMTAPALRKELDTAGVPVELVAKVPQPTLARWVEEIRTSKAPVAESAGRFRQVVIDRRRAVAEALSEADELLANGASAATLGARGRAALAKVEKAITGWPDEAPLRALVTAMATGNPAQVRRAIKAAQTKLGLRQIGDDAGKLGRFDRATMKPIGGTIPDGAQVVVVRPGYEVEIGGQRVVLSRPVVEVASPAEQIKAILAPVKSRTKRTVEIANAKAKLPAAQRRLRNMAADNPQRASLEQEIERLQSVIDQKPGPIGYNWESPSWDEPASSMGRLVAEPTPELLAAHVDSIVGSATSGWSRREVADELTRQAQLTPRTSLDLRAVGKSSTFGGNDVYAEYDLAWREIRFAPRWADRASLESSLRHGIDVHFHPPTGGSVFDSVVAHEYGHHVTCRILDASAVQQRRVIEAVDAALRLDGYLLKQFRANGGDLAATMNDFLKSYLATGRADRVSGYARKNYQEFFAELWAEYTTGNPPRPHIRAIGDIMRDVAESVDTVNMEGLG